MSLLEAVILGAVEGLTEFLPVSSTGHLILASRYLGLEQNSFLKTFEISIQLGAILSVVVLYGKRLFVDMKILARVAAAFTPAGILGLCFYGWIKGVLLGNEIVVVAALFLGGAGLIGLERYLKDKQPRCATMHEMTYVQAIFVGLAQALAMIPGVSRSAATIAGGLLAGVSRKTIVEFSFLLAVPTMAAATGLDLMKSAGGLSATEWKLLAAGFAVSFVVAIAAVQFLIRFIQTHTFIAFGVYRMVAAVVYYFML